MCFIIISPKPPPNVSFIQQNKPHLKFKFFEHLFFLHHCKHFFNLFYGDFFLSTSNDEIIMSYLNQSFIICVSRKNGV